ncbi:MAG: hypothetical protein KJ793_00380 [Candidatus Omnitrophica bacterium]|nr:hypothetical protein [Candidatus Omnitrophota bacterium]
MTYLFLGQDSFSKSTQLKKIKEEFLVQGTEHFNFDVFYAKELNLKLLQERLLSLPVNSPRRIVVIKGAQKLKEDLKSFLIRYVKSPFKKIILILDIEQQSKSDAFLNNISRYVKTIRFAEVREPDTFTLSRSIELKRPDNALRVLDRILKNGERPERILGGLRYAWERGVVTPAESKRRLTLMLSCDREIKTGRLKPVFALEKLVISLCFFDKSFR